MNEKLLETLSAPGGVKPDRRDGYPCILFSIGVPLVFLIVSLFIIEDYGITYDEPVNFVFGERYYAYYQGFDGKSLDWDDYSFYEGMPPAQPRWRHSPGPPYYIFPAVNVMAAFICSVTFRWLGVYSPVAAYHLVGLLIAAVFVFFFIRLLMRWYSLKTAVISAVILLTVPRLFGHAFTNTKDVPDFCLFGLSLVLFAEWYELRKIGYLAGFYLAWTLDFLVKPTAMFLPLVLLVWIVAVNRKNFAPGKIFKEVAFYALAGAGSLVFMYVIWNPPVIAGPDRIGFIKGQILHVINTNALSSSGFNLYLVKQYAVTMPILFLLAGVTGAAVLVKTGTAGRASVLLLLWAVVPVIRYFLPGAMIRDGIRYMLFPAAPLSVFCAAGAAELFGRMRPVWPRIPRNACIYAGAVIAALNVFAVVQTHPYQTSYYNCIAGGLGGAQKSRLPFASDYWLSSYREGVEWLNANAKKDSGVTWLGEKILFETYEPSLREDLVVRGPLGSVSGVEPETYILSVPRYYGNNPLKAGADAVRRARELARLARVHAVERQGGVILEIHYKPSSNGNPEAP